MSFMSQIYQNGTLIFHEQEVKMETQTISFSTLTSIFDSILLFSVRYIKKNAEKCLSGKNVFYESGRFS